MTMSRMMGTTTVDVLNEQEVVGPSLAVARTFVWARFLQCRMVPMSSSEIVKLGLNAQQIPHQMFTTTDPQMTELNRVRWRGSIFRVRGIPQNPHGMGRFWIVVLVCLSEDNGVPITGIPQELP